jgi:cytochrome b involved in lipid metabolism
MSAEKEYTAAEVAEHNTAQSLWFTINGVVYDVTKVCSEGLT